MFIQVLMLIFYLVFLNAPLYIFLPRYRTPKYKGLERQNSHVIVIRF